MVIEVELLFIHKLIKHSGLPQISLSFGLLRHAGLALSLLDKRVLDREAPDIDVVAYRGDNVKLEEIKISKSSRALGKIRGNIPRSYRTHRRPVPITRT